MDSDFSAEDDDLDLVDGSSSQPSSPFSNAADPYDFFDDDNNNIDNHKPIDRLTTLPNNTLSHILSFLPTKDAIKTSILSKKFQLIWTHSSTLSFYHNPLSNIDIPSFINSVDQTLILHNSPQIDKFHLQTDCDNLLRSSVDRWITFALRRDVKEIDLDFFGDGRILEFGHRMNYYQLPISLCSYDKLVKLRLTCVRFGNTREISWNLLKCLSLGYMILDDALVMDILSSCRMLEDLELRECNGFKRLDIGNEGLKRLRIYGCVPYSGFCQSDRELEISCSFLHSLEIHGSFRKKIKLLDVSSLADCTLNFWFLNVDNTSYNGGAKKVGSQDFGKSMSELLVQVFKVKNLTLGSKFVEALSTEVVCGRKELTALGTRCLTLDTYFDKDNLSFIWRLLRLSFRLEKLVVNVVTSQTSRKNFDDVYSPLALSFNSSPDKFMCLQDSLKSVEIKGFSGRQYETTFAEAVLNHGRLLEKMVIHCKKPEHPESNKGLEEMALLEMVRKILSFKRASAKAVVLFSW